MIMNALSDRLKYLVDLKLEQDLSTEEEQELSALLDTEPGARQYLLEMQQLHDRLIKAAPSLSPPELGPLVMSEISRVQQSKRSSDSAPVRLSMKTLNRQWLRYAAVLAAGLLLGSAMSWLLLSEARLSDTRRAAGSMVVQSGQSSRLSGEGYQVQISPVSTRDLSVIILSVTSEEEIEVILQYDSRIFRLDKARYLRHSGPVRAQSSAGGLHLFLQGEAVFQLDVIKSPGLQAPVSFELISRGIRLEQGEMLIQ